MVLRFGVIGLLWWFLFLLLDAVAFPCADQVGLVHPQAIIFDDAVFRDYLAQACRVVLLAGVIIGPGAERVAAGQYAGEPHGVAMRWLGVHILSGVRVNQFFEDQHITRFQVLPRAEQRGAG